MLATGESDEAEIRDAITDDLRVDLPELVADVRRDLAPPRAVSESTEDRARLIVELSKYLRHGGATFTPSAQDEWLDGVIAELSEYPMHLLVESIGRARKRIRAPWEMVSWVVADIEPAVERLRIEESRLARLAEIAGA